MFFVNKINGSEPYQPGIFRAKRVTHSVAPVPSVESAGVSSHSNPSLKPAIDSTQVLAAYEKSVHPDTPRRRTIYANEIMSKNVETINENAPLAEAARIFSQRRFRHIPVLNPEKLLTGIISDRDLLRHSSNRGEMTNLVKTIMTHPILVASDDTEIREVARVMFEERIGCMPITTNDGALTGIITRSDILRTLVMQAPLELWR